VGQSSQRGAISSAPRARGNVPPILFHLSVPLTEDLLVYVSLFGWSFLAATIVPLGSEPALFAAVVAGYPLWPAVAVATLGNVLGACTTYWLAQRTAGALERRGAAPITASRAGQLLRRFGQPALLLSWVPLFGDALVAAAGAVSMPILPFFIWMSAGKAGRYIVVAWTADAWR
jgi:membrane protein YqaA with SNARE-associated domain